jgi:hypothetical protein
VNHVEWSRQATIYEVNLRQYTPEGTIKAFGAHLPRLSHGCRHPLADAHPPDRPEEPQGHAGSYYAVRDYTAVNGVRHASRPEGLVADAHRLGMKVIIDWVATTPPGTTPGS